MRLFIAINIEDKIKTRIIEVQKEINIRLNNYANLKPVEESKLHLTLNFIGDSDDQTKIIQALKEIKFNSFQIRLNKIDFFQTQKNPRVIFLSSDSKGFNELSSTINQKLNEFGIKNQLSDKLHLTLFRIKNIYYDKYENYKFKQLLEKIKQDFPNDSKLNKEINKEVIQVNSFELMNSSLDNIKKKRRETIEEDKLKEKILNESYQSENKKQKYEYEILYSFRLTNSN